MYLIFDTNSVRMLAPEGNTADLLRIIKSSGKAKIAIPEMVLQEMVAQQVIEYRDAHSVAEAAFRRLRGRYPEGFWNTLRFPTDSRVDDLRQAWERIYKGIFEVIPTSAKVALTALIREANGEKPAKLGGKPGERKKEGARDVAIWLSIVEYMRRNPNERVYFVTNNSKDFGDGAKWPPPMDQDILGMEDRITLLSDMNAVIDTFAERVPDQDLRARAAAVIAQQESHMPVQAFRKVCDRPLAASLLSPRLEREGVPRRTMLQHWLTPPSVELVRISNAVGHRIGDDIWFTASVKWLLWGRAKTWDRKIGPLATFWNTRMLVSTSGKQPTILSSRPQTERLTKENMEEWQYRVNQIYEDSQYTFEPDDYDDLELAAESVPVSREVAEALNAWDKDDD
ncbi:PIN domain-containing protein [Streptomyces sp. NPDC001698]|uniref:PIN domain-containing protein n=1 Tax=Streptomyces sp. NPDC001698 TaxID=3364601 RepID=UPI0036AFB005